jgi:UDP-glucose 4-epimerase
MKKILITGGAGFIGSQLGKHLSKLGHDVTLLDNMSDGYQDNIIDNGKILSKFVLMDIRDPSLFSIMSGIDIVFHFAATSSLPKCQQNPLAAYDNNVMGLINVLEAAKENSVDRVIFSSTSAVYENNDQLPFLEGDSVSPDLVYASSKLAGEKVCSSYSSCYGMDIVITRFFNIYGEHQDIHRTMPPFVSYLAKEVYFDRAPILFNETDSVRDYVYVEDIIASLLFVMNSSLNFNSDIFNLCSGSAYSVKEIVALYSEISGKKIKPVYRDPSLFWDKFPALFIGKKPLSRQRIEKEVYKNSIGSGDKFYNQFGFRPKVSMEDGLRSVFEFSKKQLGII